MTLLSRDSNPLLSNAAAMERGHGAPWSGEAGQAGDQGVLLAPIANGGSVENGADIVVKPGYTLIISGVVNTSGGIELQSDFGGARLEVNGDATLTGGGTVSLTGTGGAYIDGVTATNTLTNFDNTISGVGFLGAPPAGAPGQMTLINDAKGVIDGIGQRYGDNVLSLVLDTSGETVTNNGLIESSTADGYGGLTISNTTVNDAGGGVILANAGSVLVLSGAVIVGGTLSQVGTGAIRPESSTLDGTHGAVHIANVLDIGSHYGLEIDGTIANAGTIGVLGGGFYDATLSVGAAGATLTGGGQVYLASRGLIQSAAAGDTLTNFDNTISGSGILGARSGSLTLINDAKGVIDGNAGIALRLASGSGTIFNDGLIEATSSAGIVLMSGVVDGSGGGTILAANGGIVTLGAGHVAGGTLSTAGSGVILSANGYMDGTHAAVHNTGALNINDNLDLAVIGTINNTGTISVLGGGFYDSFLRVVGSGATLTGGGQVNLASRSYINAAAGAAFTNDGNTISGNGNFFYGSITVVNRAGVIDANGSAALTLPTVGGVFTNGGTLEATGTGGLIIQNAAVSGTGGTIFAGAGSSVSLQSVTVRGGTSSTAAGGAIDVGSGSTASLAGATVNAGTINLASGGAVANLVVSANTTLTGGGTISLGTALFDRIYGATATTVLDNVDNTISGSGFIGLNRLTLINGAKGIVDATGGGTIVLETTGETVSNAGLLEAIGGGHLNIQATTVDNAGGGVVSAATGSSVGLRGATLIGGTLETSGTGRIVTFAGANLIDGTTAAVTNAGEVSISDDTSLTMQGAVANSGRILINASSHNATLTVGTAGLALSGGGQVNLNNNAFNRVRALTGAATLTNVDNTITGAGQLGDGLMTLNNEAKGTIDATGSVALTLNTGTATITNAGLIEAAGSGGAIIKSAIANTGKLEAAGGNLSVNAAVTGAGSAVISGGTLDFLTTFSQAVAFTGKSGTLELARSQTYTASITGFSKTGGTSLDLGDIAFKSAGQATFNGTATSGVLTVTDGTHTAHITLIGNYLATTFTASSDGHGGTKVVDTGGAAAAPAAHAHAFIAAMAGLGAGAGAAACAQIGRGWREHQPVLVGPPRPA